ncbi:MAG TPA: HEPN domain-containing protein [Ignavibacteriaceae bacterium]|nr:HEPN domain-containing protein [Ignavibacteriaceae bacterium]
MDSSAVQLSKYRIEKALEELSIAINLLTQKFYAKSLNSTYYSMFHATRALLATEKVDSKRHVGIIMLFNKFFINTEKIPEHFFTFLDTAFNIRILSDYRDFYIATKQDAEKQIQNAEKFLEMAKDYLSKLDN